MKRYGRETERNETRDSGIESRRRDGFTLIEIMAVVLIMGLLAAFVGTAVVGRVNQSRQTTARVQIKSLESNISMYQVDNGRFPTTDQGLDALTSKPNVAPEPRNYPPGGYLNGEVPTDPWGNEYEYRFPGERNPHKFDLWSWGADGQPGGEGIDSDVGNWSEHGA